MHCSGGCSACMRSAMSTRTSGCRGRRTGYPGRAPGTTHNRAGPHLQRAEARGQKPPPGVEGLAR